MQSKSFLLPAVAAILTACGYIDYSPEPFKVEWATCNLGASAPEDPGTYFAWGETAGKTHYGWDNYLYSTAEPKMTKYNPAPGTPGTTVLEPGDDAASVILGNGWRMPTKADWDELVRKGFWEKTVRNGVAGYRVISRIDREEIVFLPVGGFYNGDILNYGHPEIYTQEDGSLMWKGAHCHFWTSELRNDYNPDAWYFGLADEGYGQHFTTMRSYGMNIRPVRDK